MQLSTYVRRLDERLDTDAYADVDASANGLQVGPTLSGSNDANQSIGHVAFAVDAAVDTIEAAADMNAEVLVTHHGLSWGGIERVTGRTYDRIAALMAADMALYVSHLPLDGHLELGNAAGVAETLTLDHLEPFGELGPVTIGTIGDLPDQRTVTEIANQLAALDGSSREPHVLPFGPETIDRVAIVTGSGVEWLDEAVEAGADVLVTGEGKQQVYHDAREAGITVILAGHYATETFGVRSLASLSEAWGLETTYISHPTGL